MQIRVTHIGPSWITYEKEFRATGKQGNEVELGGD